MNGSFPLTPDADPPAQPLRWSLTPSTVAIGPARGVVEVVDGRFDAWRPAGSTLTGQLILTDVAAPPARIDATRGALTAQLPWLATDAPRDGIAVQLDGDRLDASYLSGLVQLLADGVPLTVADASGPLQADLALDPSDPLASLRGTASYAPTSLTGQVDPSGGASDAAPGSLPRLVLDAGETGLLLETSVPAGTALAGRSLARDLRLRASLDASGTGDLTGDLTGELAAWAGNVALLGRLSRTAEGLAFDGALASGGTVAGNEPTRIPTATLRGEPDEDRATPGPGTAETLRTELRETYPAASLATVRVTRIPTAVTDEEGSATPAEVPAEAFDAALAAELDGSVDLASVSALFGVDVTGTLVAEGVRLTPGEADGRARATLTAPVETALSWNAGTLGGAVPTPLGEVAVSGSLRPGAPVTATLRHAWGQATWRDGALSGSGTVPARDWRGVRLDAVPWSLDPTSLDAITTRSSTSADGGGLRVRIADGQATWSDGRVQARLDLPGAIADTQVRLQGDATYQPGAAPSLDLAVVPAEGGPALVRAEGTFEDLRLGVDAPARTVAAAAQLGVDAQGRIDVDGRLDLAAGRLDVSGRWSAGDASLRIAVDRSDDTTRITVVGDDLDAEVGPDGASFRAAEARLGAFLPALERLVLDGALAVSPAGDGGADQAAPLPTVDTLIHGAWRGELRVDVAELGSIVLTGRDQAGNVTSANDASANDASGRDGSLLASARWSGAGATAEITGTVTPALDLVVSGAHPPSGATLDARIAGPLQSPGPSSPFSLSEIDLSGTLRIADLATEGYGLTPTELTLDGPLSAPRLIGPSGQSLRLESGQLSGELTLEALVAGQPHLVEVRVDGPPAAPRAVAQLRGPHAQLDATLDADPAAEGEVATVSGSIAAEAWPPAAASAAPGRATLRGGVSRDGQWTATIEAGVAPAGRPLEVILVGEGDGLEGSAQWRLASPDGEPLLSGQAQLSGGLATVSTDLSSLDAAAVGRWAGIDVRADASGRLTASWRASEAPALRLEADVEIDGQLDGREVALAASFSDEGRPTGSVRLRVGDEEITAELAPGADAWTVQAAGDAYALSGRVATDVTSVELEGTLADAPLELRVAREARGALLGVASWSGAQASLGLRPQDDRWSATLDVAVPARAALPAAGTFSARGAFEDGEATVEHADLVVLEPTDLRADLSGRIWPNVELRGAVTGSASLTGATGPVALSASGAWDALAVRATTPGLALGAELNGVDLNGVDLVRLELRGEGRELAGVRIVPDAGGLAWNRTEGWSGAAVASWAAAGELETAGAPPTVTATLDGRGEALALALDGEVGAGAATADLDVDARLVGPPWNTVLDGSGQLRVVTRSPAAASTDPAPTDPAPPTCPHRPAVRVAGHAGRHVRARRVAGRASSGRRRHARRRDRGHRHAGRRPRRGAPDPERTRAGPGRDGRRRRVAGPGDHRESGPRRVDSCRSRSAPGHPSDPGSGMGSATERARERMDPPRQRRRDHRQRRAGRRLDGHRRGRRRPGRGARRRCLGSHHRSVERPGGARRTAAPGPADGRAACRPAADRRPHRRRSRGAGRHAPRPRHPRRPASGRPGRGHPAAGLATRRPAPGPGQRPIGPDVAGGMEQRPSHRRIARNVGRVGRNRRARRRPDRLFRRNRRGAERPGPADRRRAGPATVRGDGIGADTGAADTQARRAARAATAPASWSAGRSRR
ncbi:MAG: hypothetical protein U5J97_06240 [Trueperaceae bacterium]|nr:hypothetical protein [Trueperaceae bacterium]